MQLSIDTINRLIDQKLITVKASKNYPHLSVIKYTRKCFFDQRFGEDEFLTYARGLIVDSNFNPVVIPFQKVFNRNEVPDADISADNDVLLVRKINGFLGVVTAYNGEWIYSTTGSLDSVFCDYIRDMVGDDVFGLPKIEGTTYLFEIVHPDDPHIIEEPIGAYLIGARSPGGDMVEEATLDVLAKEFGILRPSSFTCKMREVNTHLKPCRHEGFMVHDKETGKIIKMKSPFYLLRKLLARKKELNDALLDSQRVKQHIEEELYCVVDAIRDNMESFNAMNEQQRLAFMTEALFKEK